MEKIIDMLKSAQKFANVTNQYSDDWEYCDIARNNLLLYFKQMK